MAGGNGLYFAAAALLTSVVLGLLLYQSRWTASARGGWGAGHEGFAPEKGAPIPADQGQAMNLASTGVMFTTAGTSFCSLVEKASDDVYVKAMQIPMTRGRMPVNRKAAMKLCGAIGFGSVGI